MYEFRGSFALLCPLLHTLSYLSSEAKRANSELRDPVVLEKHALRLVGHSDRDGGEVLRLAAHSHGRRVAHAQVRARRCRTWLAEDQPHHQPKGETAWRRAGRKRWREVSVAEIIPYTDTGIIQGTKRLFYTVLSLKLDCSLYQRTAGLVVIAFEVRSIYSLPRPSTSICVFAQQHHTCSEHYAQHHHKCIQSKHRNYSF